MFLRDKKYETISVADVRGIKVLPAPRGVPPKYPLLEIEAPSHIADVPLFIDPNYFTASSLTAFIEDLRSHVPEMRSGSQIKVVDHLLKLFSEPARRS